jgi:hypothetical protein
MLDHARSTLPLMGAAVTAVGLYWVASGFGLNSAEIFYGGISGAAVIGTACLIDFLRHGYR